MTTYGDVKKSPSGWGEAGKQRSPHMAKDIELQIRELIDSMRKTGNRDAVVAALRTQTELVARDETWPLQAEGVEPIGDKPISQPTEAEMKHAAAAQEAANMAKSRGIEDDYMDDSEADAELKRREEEEMATSDAPDRARLERERTKGESKAAGERGESKTAAERERERERESKTAADKKK